MYKVDVFVESTTTSAQSPQPAVTTAYYVVTVDRGQGWKITDVSGSGTGI
ncbi:hypothetical protein ACIRRA_11835 [Nocardia sp. NPDC101769]